MARSAEVITVGTELLLGEILDTNVQKIALGLREIGLDLYRTTSVGDNAERISRAVQQSLARSQAVLVTGGLGPTVDDVTREGIALALGVETVFVPELWEQIKARFAAFGRSPTENNRRQAHIPEGALPVENPVGTAPAFLFEKAESVVIALPGVPAEMDYLLRTVVLPYLRKKFGLGEVIIARRIRTAGVGESWLDERIRDLEGMENPTVGVSAHPGRVDIRLTAKAANAEQAQAMLDDLERTVQDRLGETIYGRDGDTLESVTLALVAARGWRLASIESNTQGTLAAALSGGGAPYAGGYVLPSTPRQEELATMLSRAREQFGAEVGIGIRLVTSSNETRIDITFESPGGSETIKQSYGGSPVNAPAWAVSLALDRARRILSAA